MITNTKTISPLITSSDMPASEMGMDDSGKDLAALFLRDKIYSDKIKASCREYITNALDEHVKYKIERPVEVSLIGNKYSVRDFAQGLSEYDIRNIFGMYFKSTKTENNEQSGMFGLGSKAFFSYTDSFYVRSHFEGICTLYCATLAPGKSGIPVGSIIKVSEEPTEESGLEVSCEIQVEDVRVFDDNVRHIISTCSSPIKFISNDGGETTPQIPLAEIMLGENRVRLFDHWRTELQVSMGNITYLTIREQDFKNLGISALLKNGHLLHISLPIGSMSLPISRESFETTKANTRALEDLYASLKDLAEKESQPLKDLPLEEIIKNRDKTRQAGQFFDYSIKNLYPSTFSVLSNIELSGAKDGEKLNSKFIIALIPNKKSKDYWEDKLEDHCCEIEKSYYFLNEKYINDTPDNKHLDRAKLEESFVFKPVKNKIFGWVKKEAQEKPGVTEYSIRYKVNDRVQRENWNPLEWHQATADELKLDKAAPDQQIAEFLKKFETAGTHRELNEFLISCRSSTNDIGTSITSRAGYEEFIKLGWYNEQDPRYLAARAKLNERLKIKQEKEGFLSFVKSKFDFLEDSYHARILKLGRKHKIEKMFNKLENISKEKTLRGKIMKNIIAGSYYYSPKYSRNELRRVLQITP